MFAVLALILGWMRNLALSFLPLSPFASASLPEGVTLGLGWLNWLMPVGDMILVLDAWLLAAMMWALYRAAYRITKVVTGSATGSGK